MSVNGHSAEHVAARKVNLFETPTHREHPGSSRPRPRGLMKLDRSGTLYARLRRVRNVAICRAKGWHGVHSTSYVHSSCHVARDLVTEEYVFIASESWIAPMTTIGRYTMLAPRVAIVGGDHVSDRIGVPMHFSGRPAQISTRIGRDVWLGYGAILIRGVTIGEGAIVAAGAVVTKDVPSYEVWAGTPAARLGKRFETPEAEQRHTAMIDGAVLEPCFADRQETVDDKS